MRHLKLRQALRAELEAMTEEQRSGVEEFVKKLPLPQGPDQAIEIINAIKEAV